MGRNKKNTKRKNAPAPSGTAPAGESSTSAGESSTSANRTTGEKEESKFFVGLDFGTTFTSVAFAYSESPNEIKLVDIWPDAATGSNSAEQVPTKVEYMEPEMAWGYEVQDGAINPGSKPLEWFKLLLQGRDATLPVSQNRSRHAGGRATAVSEVGELLDGLNISPWETAEEEKAEEETAEEETAEEETPEKETKKILDELNITTVTLIADFLRKIKETTLATIKKTYWMQSEIGAKIVWILTVPAIWKDAAKNSMILAAKKAGLGERGVDFELTSEPECGATYSLNVIQPNDLSPGDVFVICDAGGGTADLISYKITANQPLRVDEVVPATGALCGSVFLDRRFSKYMRRTLGDEFFNSMKPKPKAGMMKYWENTVKLKFGNGTKPGGYEVIVPGVDNNEKLNVEDGYHSMKYEDVKAIFDPTVDEIIHLVSQQVSKVKEKGENVKAIILVGGFGSSEYLHYRLSNHTYGDRKIKVLQPVNARTAIARGALLRGLEGSIIMTRCAPRHYGNEFEAEYNPGDNVPPGALLRRYFHPLLGSWMIPDKMNWHVKKGEAIEPSRASFTHMHLVLPGEQPDSSVSVPLYACDLDQAPEYMWQNPTAIRKVCTLNADLSSIPRYKYTTLRTPIGDFMIITYEYRMTLVNEVWQFELFFEGKRYGVVETQFTEMEAEEEGR